jgi:murein DD-endopeptidase MepM/ murein hydrolase activator NlpD
VRSVFFSVFFFQFQFRTPRSAFFLILLLLGGLLPSLVFGGSGELRAAFQTIRPTTVWPVIGTTFDAIESTFGPRIQASTGLYDWHRGIDIDAPEGTPVLAVTGGILWNVTTYPDGGLTIILRHTFPSPVPYAGLSLPWYYTLYMHLSSVDAKLVTAASAGQHPVVAAGTQIGTVGHSGTAIGDHLHLELRVGTQCSLEYQLNNPTSSCAGFGFDPHMHPLWLFVPTLSNPAISIVKLPGGKNDGQGHFTIEDDQPLLNQVVFTVIDRASKKIVRSHVLDFNERLGYDATSTEALDTVNTSRPYISPIPFGMASSLFATDIIIPKSFVGKYYSGKYLSTLTVTDIWGKSAATQW